MGKIIGSFFIVFALVVFYVFGDDLYNKQKEEEFDIKIQQIDDKVKRVEITVKQPTTVFAYVINKDAGGCRIVPNNQETQFPLTLSSGDTIDDIFYCDDIKKISIFTEKNGYIYER